MALAAMNRRTFLAAACAAPALTALRAQSPAVESGFVPLFDGQSLAGWSVQEGPPSAFRLTDGAIVVDQGSNFPAWLRSDRQYENFDFRCEFFLRGWMNSGLYLHAPAHGRNIWVGMKSNDETVLEYEGLENLEPGHIELQAHDAGKWIEYKEIRIRSLGSP
jgi:Domain of Unknown Function (DUF1080)